MALFGRDYDRGYGTWNRGPDYGYRGAYGGPNTFGRYDRDYGYMGGAGYDRNYKDRWQTDYGDPYGDRTSHTPMRMIRGEFRGGYDRDMWGTTYDRDYTANPMGYDPYYGYGRNTWGRTGTWNRGYDRNFRTYGRGGYDRGWF